MKKFTFLIAVLLCTVWMAYGQWTYTSLTEPKSDMGSVSLGTKVYFAGGYNGSDPVSLVEIYDVETGTWDTPGNLSVARQWPTCVACGTKIFFAGGLDYDANVVFNTIDILDTETGEWTVEQLSVPRFDLAAVSYGSKVLFAGGFQFPYNTFSVVDIYDVESGEWTTANLSQNRGGIARAVVGDQAIFAGGSVNSYTTSDRVDIYNFTTNTWSQTILSQARMYASATTVGDKVLIAGGCTGMNAPSDRVDIYDASDNSWTISNLSVPRSWFGNAATVNGKAYFAGGGIFSYGFHSPTDIIDIYNESSVTWSLDYLFEPLVSHAVVSSGDYLVIAGGVNDGNLRTAMVEIFYDPYVPHIIHVPGDYPTIQEGIDAAHDNDTVLVANSTYYENINFNGKAILVASEFILDGDTNHIVNTIIDGSQPVNPDIGSVVSFTSGEDTTSVLCGFTISGGTGTLVAVAGNARLGGGVMFGSGGKLINNHIEDNNLSNEGWAGGGGIFAGGPLNPMPWVVLRENRITYNSAMSSNDQGTGGGIEIWFNLVMEDNQLSYNEANGAFRGDGGGARISGNFGHIVLILRNNLITHNKAESNNEITDLVISGGLDVFLDCSGTISNNVISFNEIEVANYKWGYGTGVLIEAINDAEFIFENNLVTDNTFTSGNCMGGGLLIYDATGKYQNNVVQNNYATHGGGVGIGSFSTENQPVLINNTITGNEGVNGGGLYISETNAIVFNTIIWDNTAPEGASIYQEASTLEVRYSDVEGDVVWPGEGNINEEPLFLSDGFHLDYTSTNPVVNAGILSVSINGIVYECPPYDIDGDLRPYLNTHPEIGVDEVPVLETGVSVSSSSLFINLYPNPADQIVTISVKNGAVIKEVSIYNQFGQIIYNGLPEDNTIDVSKLQPGVYLIEMITNQSEIREKLIIE